MAREGIRRGLFRGGIYACLCLVSFVASAQTEMGERFPLNSLAQDEARTSKVEKKSLLTGESSSDATIELGSAQYFRSTEPYYRDGATSTQTSMKLGWNAQWKKGIWKAGVRLRDDYQAEEDFHYFKPFEFKAGLETEKGRLLLGRSHEEWSVSDEHWRLGLWQPRFLDDKLTRETAGFTGVFWGMKGEKTQFLVHASPIFVPDMGANFEHVGSQFYSKNPWFQPPTSAVDLDGMITEVRYDVNQPSEVELISHPMAAAQLVWKPRNENFVRLSGAYKPMNQILFGFPLIYHLQDPKYASVQVEPRVLYHQVLTLEGGVKAPSGWKSWASVSEERPIRDNTPEEWTTQEAAPAQIYSMYLGREFKGSGAANSEAYISYLRVDGGDGPDRGEFTSEESLFEPRYMFQSIVQVGGNYARNLLSSRWLTRVSGSMAYEFAQHGVIASMSLAQQVSKYWSLKAYADFIGLLDQSGEIKNGFTSQYRANDRVGLGVQYVF